MKYYDKHTTMKSKYRNFNICVTCFVIEICISPMSIYYLGVLCDPTEINVDFLNNYFPAIILSMMYHS